MRCNRLHEHGNRDEAILTVIEQSIGPSPNWVLSLAQVASAVAGLTFSETNLYTKFSRQA